MRSELLTAEAFGDRDQTGEVYRRKGSRAEDYASSCKIRILPSSRTCKFLRPDRSCPPILSRPKWNDSLSYAARFSLSISGAR
ncbi:hypothetical protein QYF36_016211 [Acer negundo]|nr:hypothetical protein QYF36_016211 [Acer negundo]